MSKFFRALEQAKRDRALRTGAPADQLPLADTPSEPAPPVALPAIELRRPRPVGVSEERSGVVDEELDEHLVSLVTPAAFEAEQYRSLRHTVEHLHRTVGVKVIAVSSPAVGDGKTLTAINLAGSLAQAPEARVLLIDADLRRPSVGRLLSLGDTSGGLVGAILDPNLTLDRIVEPRPPFNLAVICAGQTPPSPYEVLKSPRLGDLLDAARGQYDFIIVDTPPLTPMQDCRVIGRWVDGFLLVVAANRTPRRLLEEALTTLDRTKVLGIVFNQDERTASGHYAGYYDGYYFSEGASPNGDSGGALKRAVRKVGDSLRGRRESSRTGTGSRAGTGHAREPWQ